MRELIEKHGLLDRVGDLEKWCDDKRKTGLEQAMCIIHDMPVINVVKTLGDTVELMNSADYKERFKAEYYQTKYRYEKLKAFNAKIEAASVTVGMPISGEGRKIVEMPAHDCPDYLLREQQKAMGEYLHILEVRAVIENIEL